jgi:hypothetical protein
MLQVISRTLRVPSILQTNSFAVSNWTKFPALNIAEGPYRLSYLFKYNAGVIVAKNNSLVTAELNEKSPGDIIYVKRVGTTHLIFGEFKLQHTASQKWIQATEEGNKFVEECDATTFKIEGHADLHFYEVIALNKKGTAVNFGVSSAPGNGNQLKLVGEEEAFQFLSA